MTAVAGAAIGPVSSVTITDPPDGYCSIGYLEADTVTAVGSVGSGGSGGSGTLPSFDLSYAERPASWAENYIGCDLSEAGVTTKSGRAHV